MLNFMEKDIVLLGVIFDPKTRKILIGRREQDKHIPQLTWAFLGGRPKGDKELDEELERRIKEKTGLDIKNLGNIFARILPEKEDMLVIYFLCEVIGGEENLGDDTVELKWVSPDEIESHFTTSFHPKLKEYIMNLK